MTLGEHIRTLRNAKGLSQPEFAKIAQIEQSYLSKLENDKSLPSNEIFRQILSAFQLSVAEFLLAFDRQYLSRQLSQIPDIEHWLLKTEQVQTQNQRYILYISSVLIVVAVTCFYTGFSKIFFTGIKFQYESSGIILEGEPKNIYANWHRLLDKTQPNYHQISLKRELELEKRRDNKTYTSEQDLGEGFMQQVEGGQRWFRFDRKKHIPQIENAWLQIIGVLLFSAGIMGFVLERKLFK